MKFPNEIKAYQTSDGTLHVGYADAVAHEHKLYVDSKVEAVRKCLHSVWSENFEPTSDDVLLLLDSVAVQEALEAMAIVARPAQKDDAITALISAATELLDFVKDGIPESNCGCHLNAPCDDCVNNAFPRELCSALEEALKTIQKGDQK